MSGPPRRPPGPPPPRAPVLTGVTTGSNFSVNSNSIAGSSDTRKPPGPPPSITPVTSIKPPPTAPPPQILAQAQRPAVTSFKSNESTSTNAPLSPMSSSQARGESSPFRQRPLIKEGAISMFEEPDGIMPQAIAEKKDGRFSSPTRLAPLNHTPSALSPVSNVNGIPLPRGIPPPRAPLQSIPQQPMADPTVLPLAKNRAPRPLPPQALPPGIPEGQPLPPNSEPDKESKAPPPIRPPPNRNRAPPKQDPNLSRVLLMTPPSPIRGAITETSSPNPAPPDTEPPLLRVKRPKQEVAALKRREKDMPEFEESDEDEPEFVQQPLPFSVLKEPLPVSSLDKSSESKDETKKVDQSIKQKTTAPSTPQAIASAKPIADAPMASGKKSTNYNVVQPLIAPESIKHTELVPSAPEEDTSTSIATGLDVGKHFDDSSLGKDLSRGRLSIKCIEGYEIRRPGDNDKIPRNDPFIKFRLGAAERHPWKSTQVKRKQDANPKFDDEVVAFDVTDPMQYIMDEDIQLYIEVWNKSTLRDEKIGAVTMSVVRFFKRPFLSYVEKVPIYASPTMKKTATKVLFEFIFEEARSGLFQFTLYEARGLRNIDPMGHQVPFVQFSLGRNYKKRTKCVKGGGTNPYFEEEKVLLWVDQTSWVDDLRVELLDEDAKEEKPIGYTHFPLLPYMKNLPDEAKEETYDLFYLMSVDPKDDREKKEVACGEVDMRVRFFPAGKLSITLEKAKDLQFPELYKPASGDSQRMDPYVSLTMEGKAVRIIKRTAADKDGGSDPVWQSTIEFEVVDQYLMELEVFNQNLFGKDVSLGSTQISLLNVFRGGYIEYWTSFKQKKSNGGIREVGDIFVKLQFVGPVGIAYPQDRTEVDSFDDALRKIPGQDKEPTASRNEDEIKPPISTIPELAPSSPTHDAMSSTGKDSKPVTSMGVILKKPEEKQEFSDDEIMAAFKFIDLDHNNFVGAAEIRHILVCMGEMITDEEIDMMISMVDLDGDGQVSYKEFRTLVLHPNPGAVDMHKEVNKEKDAELVAEKQALTGKTQGLDLSAFQRQKEMAQREQKKKMISTFVIDNEVDMDYIKKAHIELLELPKEKRINGRIKFPEFCKVLNIEPLQEYKNLHSFYDTEELGDMDLREFLLSMMNFVEVDQEERIKFSFHMFDEFKTGYIAQKEVEEILRGNHMISLASVKRKAETIMKQATLNKSAAITLNEFVVVSKKFPNILLPAVGLTQVARVG